jgi:hypothetical protein
VRRQQKKPGKLIAEEFISCFTMIVGEINSGKTTLTQQILEVLCKATDSMVTVVDFAPEITPQDLEALNKTTLIGGTLQIQNSARVRYYHPRIHPPRLRARDESEAEALAGENLRTIETLLDKALLEDTDAIFINDCSLYLHAGSASKLLDVINSFPTSVVNGYFGRFFSSYSISIRERTGMQFLMRHCDRLIKIS